MNTVLGVSMTLLQLFALCGALPREVTLGQVADSIRDYLSSGAAQAKDAPVSESTWRWSENDVSVTVTIRGQVEFAEDSTDVVSIGGGGVFVLDEKAGDRERKIEISPGPNGGLERAYSLNNEPHEFDREARTWFSGSLSATLAKSGLDADSRAARLLKQGGARLLIEESRKAKSDRARAIYLETAIKSADLDAQTLSDILRVLLPTISTDFERGKVLLQASDVVLNQPALIAVYFEEIGRLESSFEQRRVLTTVLKSPKARSRDTLLQALDVGTHIPFEADVVTFLAENASLYQADGQLRDAFAKAVSSIRSDSQRQRLQEIISNGASKTEKD